jgi:Tfp pilus assembly PilM family ATPase
MKRALSYLNLDRFSAPVRRVLALDGGSRRLKYLLMESSFGRLRILAEEMLDLQVEGLVGPEELKTHLGTVIQRWNSPPLALVLPEHLSMSQVIDLPLAPESEVDKLIADETIKLSGVAESRIIYDFVRRESPVENRQQFWVTVCQEADIRERILRLGLEQEALCDVTTTANALIAAFRASLPLCSRAILVHLGAQTTVVVVLLAGQGAFSTSFQMGGDFFTRALARLQNCSQETAEALKCEKDLLNDPEPVGALVEAIEGWASELKRQLNEWFQTNLTLAAEVRSFELIASGGGFNQPGLLEYLKREVDLDLQPWPISKEPDAVMPSRGFEIAFGAALQALGHHPQAVSLVPEDYRLAWRKRAFRQRLELASFAVLALCIVALAFGTWHKVSLLRTKQVLLAKVLAAQDAVEANDALTSDLVGDYEHLRPILADQQNTMDTLRTLNLVLQSRSKGNFWYVLLSDQQSYFSRPPALLSTNRPARTNLVGSAVETLRPPPIALRTSPAALTNVALAKPGLIAELVVPGEADASRQLLSEIVSGLKQQPMFSKVDLLSDDLRRNLSDPKVAVPDRQYVLSLDFAETEFQQPVQWKKPVVSPRVSRRPKPALPNAEAGELGPQLVP